MNWPEAFFYSVLAVVCVGTIGMIVLVYLVGRNKR